MNRKKIIATLILILATGTGVFAVAAAIVLALTNNFKWSIHIFTDKSVWTIWGTIIIGLIILLVINATHKPSKRILALNRTEDQHWMTKKEFEKNPNIVTTKFSKLAQNNDGILLSAFRKRKFKKDLDITIIKPIHTLVIGTTRTGKTSGYVEPSMQLWARCKTKPCMVITDPKGELYNIHSKSLKSLGYNVSLIDLKDVYSSTKWNPFEEIIQKTNLINSSSVENRNGKYYFMGDEFVNFVDADNAKKVYVQILTDEIFRNIQDVIYTICPIESKGDSATWQEGARDLVFALALAFWEDVRDGYMEPKKFNLYNLYKNISEYLNEDMQEFKSYFDKRDRFSKVKGLAKTVLITQEKTLTSYLTDVNKYFTWMADTGISALTSENEIDIANFDEQPNVLFLRIPDNEPHRTKLVTLFITQMYNALVTKAERNEKLGKKNKAELMRNVYFLMDEFGNLPKFHMLDRIVTVGAGRKVFLVPIIQDFTQLENIYGKEIAAIVKSNCNVKVFIGTTDKSTMEEISALCGKEKVRSISFSEQKDMSISTQAQEKPLIYVSELQTLNDPPRMGNAIINALGLPPIKSKFTPLFQAYDIYRIKLGALPRRKVELFEEEDYFYDIKHRKPFVDAVEAAEEGKVLDDLFNAAIEEAEKKKDAEIKAQRTIVLNIDRIKKRIYKLKNQISAESLSRLISSEINEKLVVLDELINIAIDTKDNFLKFELAYIKSLIENLLLHNKTINTEVKDEKFNEKS